MIEPEVVDPAPADHVDRRAGISLRSLGPTVLSRAVDQLVLGGATLWLGVQMTPTEAAPFLTLLILYALGGQLGDGGLSFAILRTPPTERLRRRDAMARVGVALLGAGAATAVGLMIGGSGGLVVAAGGWVWMATALAFVGRADLHRRSRTDRLAVAEAGSAVMAAIAILALIRSPDDLALFAAILVGKGALEFGVQGARIEALARDGAPVRAGLEWLGQAATYAVANVDYLLIGVLLTPADLAVYAVAFRLASGPSSVIAAPLTRSAFVGFAGPSDGRGRAVARLHRMVAVGGLAGVAAVAVGALALRFVLGEDWSATAALAVVLAVALPWRLVLGPTVALAITAGRADRVVAWELRRLVLVAASVGVGALVAGLAGAAIGATSATIVGVAAAHDRALDLVDAARSVRGWWAAVAVGLAVVGSVAVGLNV